MSSPRTTPTSPGSLSRTSARANPVAARLVAYRIAAYATGVMLLVLTTSVVLHYGFGDTRLAWSGPVHGFLYMGYLVATLMLGTVMRWRPGRMVLVALAGTIPLMSFVAERSVTAEVRRQLTAAPTGRDPE
jgi:integral membrane protein